MYIYHFNRTSESFTNTFQKQETSADTEPVENTKLSKAERKAKHVELNRQIWETAYAHIDDYCIYTLL